DGIRDRNVTEVQTCALPISRRRALPPLRRRRAAASERRRRLAGRREARRGARSTARARAAPCAATGAALPCRLRAPRGGDRGPRSEERRVGEEWRARGGGAG